MIRKEGSKYVLFSKDGNKKLGTFDTRKQAEDREAEINRIKNAKKGNLVEVALTITKATLQKDGTMRWQAVTSDTSPDSTGERTSLSLFSDWIERAKGEASLGFLPPPRVPFLGLSHYPDLDGLGEAGPTEKMYVDGNVFKANGIFYPDDDHPLGKALFDAVRKEQALIKKGEGPKDPIRISAAWWDISHAHGDFVFERKSLSDRCPMCINGSDDKTYLKGQLDHFAATRVPINPRTSLELEQKGMTTTREQDAKSIIADETLVEEIDKKAKLVGKSEAEEEAPEALIVKADDDTPEVEKTEGEEMSLPFGGAMTLGEADEFIDVQRQMGEVIGNWGMFQTVMRNILDTSEPNELKGNVQNLLSEFSDRVAAIKAAIEDVTLISHPTKGAIQMAENQEHPFDVVKAEYDKILSDATLDRDAKLKALQEQFNTLGNVVKAEVDAVAPPDPGEAMQKAMEPVLKQLGLIAEKLGGQAQVQPAQQPQQKSFVPTGPVNTEPQNELPISPVTGKPSALTAMINRSVGYRQ